MKILLYSYTFLPNIGGIEVVSATLAETLIRKGHQCTVVTETESNGQKEVSAYSVARKPSLRQRIKMVRESDVIHSNGASLSLFFISLFLRKPFIWTHGGYQVSCIDGLGWVEGEKAPLTPWASFIYHRNRFGLKAALTGYLKLLIRRWASQKVSANIAVTNWVAYRQPLQKQEVIYNPFPLDQFRNLPPRKQVFDFIYVGRIVSEKGLPVLLQAFKYLLEQNPACSLVIVGDGNWMDKMRALATSLHLDHAVQFKGRKTGNELREIISTASIAVVPSIWEEPMGGVALELMAAGKILIVSKEGGLAECVGKGGLTFENGNARQLADRMKEVLNDQSLQENLKQLAQKQLLIFEPDKLVDDYIHLYKKVSQV